MVNFLPEKPPKLRWTYFLTNIENNFLKKLFNLVQKNQTKKYEKQTKKKKFDIYILFLDIK